MFILLRLRRLLSQAHVLEEKVLALRDLLPASKEFQIYRSMLSQASAALNEYTRPADASFQFPSVSSVFTLKNLLSPRRASTLLFYISTELNYTFQSLCEVQSFLRDKSKFDLDFLQGFLGSEKTSQVAALLGEVHASLDLFSKRSAPFLVPFSALRFSWFFAFAHVYALDASMRQFSLASRFWFLNSAPAEKSSASLLFSLSSMLSPFSMPDPPSSPLSFFSAQGFFLYTGFVLRMLVFPLKVLSSMVSRRLLFLFPSSLGAQSLHKFFSYSFELRDSLHAGSFATVSSQFTQLALSNFVNSHVRLCVSKFPSTKPSTSSEVSKSSFSPDVSAVSAVSDVNGMVLLSLPSVFRVVLEVSPLRSEFRSYSFKFFFSAGESFNLKVPSRFFFLSSSRFVRSFKPVFDVFTQLCSESFALKSTSVLPVSSSFSSVPVVSLRDVSRRDALFTNPKVLSRLLV